jgi:hypothetical protein
MKRSGVLLGGAILVCVLGGCDSGGLKEGMDAGTGPQSIAPNSLKDEMKRNAGNMAVGKNAAKLKQTKPKATTEK